MRIWTVVPVALVLGGSVTALALTWERHLSPAERGKYLVRALGCDDCHSPKIPGPGGMPIPDVTRLLSGHPEGQPYPAWSPADLERRNAAMFAGTMRTAWAGPWGVSFAANLTPDKETGLGTWTEAVFVETIRTGKHEGRPTSRDLLQPMPWANISHGTVGSPEDDLKAIWSFLQTLPPVRNRVPPPVPPKTPIP